MGVVESRAVLYLPKGDIYACNATTITGKTLPVILRGVRNETKEAFRGWCPPPWSTLTLYAFVCHVLPDAIQCIRVLCLVAVCMCCHRGRVACRVRFRIESDVVVVDVDVLLMLCTLPTGKTLTMEAFRNRSYVLRVARRCTCCMSTTLRTRRHERACTCMSTR